MTTIVKSPSHQAELMYAAAWAAFRTNEYQCVKVPLSPAGLPNSTLVLQFLQQPETLTPDDFEQGKNVRQYCLGLSLKLLKNDILTSFETKLLLLSEQETINESNIALISWAPVGHYRNLQRQKITDRLDTCERSHLATPGDRIETTVEVIRSTHSEKYGCYFITTITDCNHNVFFSYKEGLPVSQKYSIKGTVKAHRDGYTTQLSRVKFDNKSESCYNTCIETDKGTKA
jgi:hypothetical protein